ncbi:MAG: hypothetical protein AB7F22_28570 [Reyranella sp.]|uniref:hypothetical protein n=1 Tax=Reyranella sp. TaxID=1929291 RepID=UPI003D0B4DD3
MTTPAGAAPLNIWSRSDEEIGRLMSHFAHTPFVLDGVTFGSVEAFYTWLIVSPARRPKVAPLWGRARSTWRRAGCRRTSITMAAP